jgi:hypothetical protein
MFLLSYKLNIAFEQLMLFHNMEGSVNINLSPEISCSETFVVSHSPSKKMLRYCLKVASVYRHINKAFAKSGY